MSAQIAATRRSAQIEDRVTLALRGVSLLSAVHRLLLEEEAGDDDPIGRAFGHPRRQRLHDALDEAALAVARIRERLA